MAIHDLAGKNAPSSMLINIPRLVSSYYTDKARSAVSFGTSGHRGSSFEGSFNEGHIAATASAICEYRASKDIKGPFFLGFDTHALSEPAFRTSLEVFAAHGVEVVIHERDEYTPTPVISYLILEHNRGGEGGTADGVVITPSHNPPQDGGFKYNPPHGGPADTDVTGWIQDRANTLMENLSEVKRIPYQKARRAATTHERDFITPFITSLGDVIDMEVIRKAGIKMGADPMGGSGIHFWGPLAERYGLDMELVNSSIDPRFAFMTLDGDGEIRMDCSSPYAMANLISLAEKYDIAWGNDPDFDRHGIVCTSGLMNPNHYLSVAIWYLLNNRPEWRQELAIGKTLVSSSMIDRVVRGLGRNLYEVPVGFKWFVQGLLKGEVAFGGEESAGASFLRKDGTVWTTDKDGFALALLAAEILAKTGRSPADIYREILAPQYGDPFYRRADGPLREEHRALLKGVSPDSIKGETLAGQRIAHVVTTAPGNGVPIGGVKAILEDGSWFAVRPSGTEPKIKVYVESFAGETQWQKIYEGALSLIFGKGGLRA